VRAGRSQRLDVRWQKSEVAPDASQKPKAKSHESKPGTRNEERWTMYERTNRVTFGGCGSSNTGDAHNEPFRTSVRPVPDDLYVVVWHSRNHNSPVEWAEEGLPRGVLSKKWSAPGSMDTCSSGCSMKPEVTFEHREEAAEVLLA